MTRILPERDLAHILPLVQTPGRYTGGEYGAVHPDPDGQFLTGICFPDLYEVGMSNTAVKLLYAQLNSIDGVVCERVFSPAPDFEEYLKSHGIPLYTLENGIPLHSLDILGFSVGYELSATNILAILETGGIEVSRKDRSDTSPVIIGGGPALSNPAPFHEFFDAVYIGESENNFSRIVEELRNQKNRGARRTDFLQTLMDFPDIWMPEKKENATRGIWTGFDTARTKGQPVPNIGIVQDHGVIEIMRGCPNGCRFCHAGMYYRPFRQKSFKAIIQEADYYIYELGYRKITLSSLSTGDYSQLHDLVRQLNTRYRGLGVSFSLPSLRVNSFTLPLLEELSVVRKSGLTFAVETPRTEWQKSINKEVPVDRVVEILKVARQRGWNMAKFYFMIGLPEHLYGGEEETNAIIDYIRQVRHETGFKLNVNIGTFIPKPHTPYQWSRQLNEQESIEKIRSLKNEFYKTPVRISYHSPFISLLEGMISRGDTRVGELILSAYRKGARLDAWEEHVSYDIWREVIAESDWDPLEETCRERSLSENLPWDSIDLGFRKSYLKEELKKSTEHELTSQCVFPCPHHCGVCVKGVQPQIPEKQETNSGPIDADTNNEDGRWFLFIYQKTGKARYLSHINVMTLFERSFQRADVHLEYTQGYNPKPRLDFAQPLSLGINSTCEVARFKLNTGAYNYPDTAEIADKVNRSLPEGFLIEKVIPFSGKYAFGRGKSLMSLYYGSRYCIDPHPTSVLSMDDHNNLVEKIRTFINIKGGNKDWIKTDYSDSSCGLELFVPAAGTGSYSFKEFCNEIDDGIGPFLSKYNVTRTAIYMKKDEKDAYTDYLELVVQD